MPGERYVVLGLALPRSAWFSVVAQWAHAGVVPVEFVKCVSAEELRARLSSTRPHSALLVDVALPALDHDLVDAARRERCVVIGVSERARRPAAPPLALRLDVVLDPSFSPAELTAALSGKARLIGRADVLPLPIDREDAPGRRGRTAMVCGPGGTGTSTVAMALAQGAARRGRSTVLADLALRSEQAMLHQAPDVGPGVQELAEMHRSASAPSADVIGLTWLVEERGYRLLLGLRRRRAWAGLRPRTFELAFDGLQRAFDVVVADTDADLEGEAEGGSVDVEERHVMARTAARRADVVIVVGQPGLKGMHALLSTVAELVDFGVPSRRLLPVINQAPRSPRSRAEMARALALLGGEVVPGGVAGPLFLPRRPVDEALRDGAGMPSALVDPLVGAFDAATARLAPRAAAAAVPVAVEPGTIGSWSP